MSQTWVRIGLELPAYSDSRTDVDANLRFKKINEILRLYTFNQNFSTKIARWAEQWESPCYDTDNVLRSVNFSCVNCIDSRLKDIKKTFIHLVKQVKLDFFTFIVASRSTPLFWLLLCRHIYDVHSVDFE